MLQDVDIQGFGILRFYYLTESLLLEYGYKKCVPQ